MIATKDGLLSKKIRKVGSHNFEDKTVLVDCITLWRTNCFFDTNNNIDQSLNLAKIELNKLFNQNANLIIISNELGMGLHAETEIGRNFTDLQGWVNQFIAKKAYKVNLMISGVPLQVK